MAITALLAGGTYAQEKGKKNSLPKEKKANEQVKPSHDQKEGHGQAHGQPKSAEEKAQRATDRLDKIVGLTADQKTKIYSLALDRARKVEEIRKTNNGDQEKTKVNIKEANKNYRLAVKEILTQDQIDKLKKHAQDKKKQPKTEEIIPIEE